MECYGHHLEVWECGDRIIVQCQSKRGHKSVVEGTGKRARRQKKLFSNPVDRTSKKLKRLQKKLLHLEIT